jgi:rSAM/selenodomain-associated transferase 2
LNRAAYDAARGIAVIIPALNEEECIGPLLQSLTAMDVQEIAVADGGSSDRTVAIAQSYPRVTAVAAPKGRGRQINAAIRETRAPLLVILHADTILPAEAPGLIREALANRQAAGGCFRLRFDDPAPVLRLYAWFSRFETSLTTFGDQGYFFRRSDFEAVGGAPEWPLLEDVELRLRLKTRGKFVKLRQEAITSARRFQSRGPIACQLRNLLIMGAFWLGVSVERLARIYGPGRKPAR